jgi:long-chain acyl-CoA synthetase
MQKLWLKHYGADIPETIDPDGYDSVVDMMLEACETYGDRVAFSNFGACKTYAEVESLSRDFGAFLQQSLGVKHGDRVALMLPNMLAFPVAMLGILRIGAVQVNVNPLYTARELEHQLIDADADTIIVFAGSTATLATAIEATPIKNVIVVGLDDLIDTGLQSPPVDGRLEETIGFVDALSQGKALDITPVTICGDDLIYLQYTGGTTGISKGAMLSHRNLVGNILQFDAFGADMILPGREIIVTAIPMYHIFALMVNTLTFFRAGATNVLITNPRDMPAFVEEWSKWPVTAFTGVNTLYNGLLHTPGFADIDFSSLKFSMGGGAAVQLAVSEKWKAITGRHIREGYGLSETSPVLTVNPFGAGDFKSSIGIPVPSTDISLRDDDGNEVAQGEAGELCARGPQIMPGYWRRPEATAEVMTEDGYFRTGDIATVDEDGYFRIVDRKKDMILVSGFNVFPNEIEAEVALIDGVLECACIGVPNVKTGEAVKLFVVPSNEGITKDKLQEQCRERLAGYKVPREIEFLKELPKSTVGKILRRELRTL